MALRLSGRLRGGARVEGLALEMPCQETSGNRDVLTG